MGQAAPSTPPAPNQQAQSQLGTPALPPTPTLTAPASAPIARETKVGLMVPLTGPLANVGKALLNAAQMAVFEMGADEFQLVPRDTGGNPDGAAAAARALADEGVSLILGPLLAPEVVAAANAVQGRGIVIVAFSNDRTAARPGSVFLIGQQPSGEVQRIAGYASARGLKNFGVLAPDDAYGAVATQALQQAAPLVGITVVRTATVRPAADARETAATAKSFASANQPPIDVLLLPMGGPRLISVAAMLAYYDVDPKKVQFVGTGLWDQTDIFAEPALAGGWYPAAPPEERTEFVRAYANAYGTPPPRIANLGFDAAALAAVLAKSNRPDRFSASAITQPNGFAGVDGLFRFRPDGSAERGLAVFQATRGGPQLMEPAPPRFTDMTN